MELFRTPILHTAQGNFPVSFSTASPTPEIRNFIFNMFTRRPFFSMAAFHAFSLLLHCSSKSAMITRSSAYKSSHGAPVRNSRERASSTGMNSSGLRTEPWCTPTATPNFSLYWPFTRTRLLALVYMPWVTRIDHSSTPTLLRAHHSTLTLARGRRPFPGQQRRSRRACLWLGASLASGGR